MQQIGEDQSHLHNNVEEISADFAGETKISASIQKDDEEQQNSGHPLPSYKQESHKRAPTLSETETPVETGTIAAGVY